MISAKQIKQVLDYSFAANTGFLAPTATFTATPAVYTPATVPSTIVLSGTIIPNDGSIVSWSLTTGTGALLTTGTNTTPTYTINTPSSSLGIQTYNLTVIYTNNVGATISAVFTTQVLVTTVAYLGQLPEPGDNILIAADLEDYIADLTATTQNHLINLFTVTATNTGRIVFVIPDSFGVVSLISDNTDTNVLGSFSVVVDAPNSQKIYVSTNALTPGTYYNKFTF